MTDATTTLTLTAGTPVTYVSDRSSVRVYVQNRLLRKAGWSWYELIVEINKPFHGGPHHDREEA